MVTKHPKMIAPQDTIESLKVFRIDSVAGGYEHIMYLTVDTGVNRITGRSWLKILSDDVNSCLLIKACVPWLQAKQPPAFGSDRG